MGKTMRDVKCDSCKESFSAVPKYTFLGFIKFKCPKCNSKSFYPLSKGYRVTYWIIAIIVSLKFKEIGLLGIESVLNSGSAMAYQELAIIFLLFFIPVYALIKDSILRKKATA